MLFLIIVSFQALFTLGIKTDFCSVVSMKFISPAFNWCDTRITNCCRPVSRVKTGIGKSKGNSPVP